MTTVHHKLRWEEQDTGGFWGYSGNRTIAQVGMVRGGDDAGRWWWGISGVDVRWTCAGRGQTATSSAARRAADTAWSKWLARVSLVPVEAAHVG